MLVSPTVATSTPFINYFFDLKIADPITIVNEQPEGLVFDMPNELVDQENTEKAFLNNITQAADNVLRQRRFIIDSQDTELHSLAFKLDLHSLINSDFFLSMNSNKSNDTTDFKTNLFTLNSFDETTQKFIFLFGLHLTFKSNFKYQFEIFTSKHMVKTEPIALDNENRLNLTFTFNSIELRVNNFESSLVRLSDQIFNLFYKSLLKGYNSFQLNMTTFEFPIVTNLSSSPHLATEDTNFLFSSCMSEFTMGARRSISVSNDTSATPTSYSYTTFSLINQTRSILLYQSDLMDTMRFEQTCGGNPNWWRTNSKAKFIQPAQKQTLPPPPMSNCFLVTKIDLATNQEIIDYYDCNCSSTANANRHECSYNFWSKDSSVVNKPLDNPAVVVPSCANSAHYACFNNGTCVDNAGRYSCVCVGPYSGKR